MGEIKDGNKTAPSMVLNWIDTLPDTLRSEVLAQMKPMRMPAQTLIYERYSPALGFYRIVSGNIRLFSLALDGRELIYKVSGQTESFGDLAAIDGQPYPLSAETITDCDLLFMSRGRLSNLRAAHPELETALLEFALQIARLSVTFVEEATIFPLPARIASRLTYLAASAKARGEPVHELKVGQKDISVMVGASRQAVNKVLAEFQAQGLIETHYGAIHIKDRKGLMQQTSRFFPPRESLS